MIVKHASISFKLSLFLRREDQYNKSYNSSPGSTLILASRAIYRLPFSIKKRANMILGLLDRGVDLVPEVGGTSQIQRVQAPL